MGPFGTILDHFGPFWNILDHFGPFWSFLAIFTNCGHFYHFSSFWTIWNHFGPFLPFWPFLTVFYHFFCVFLLISYSEFVRVVLTPADLCYNTLSEISPLYAFWDVVGVGVGVVAVVVGIGYFRSWTQIIWQAIKTTEEWGLANSCKTGSGLSLMMFFFATPSYFALLLSQSWQSVCFVAPPSRNMPLPYYFPDLVDGTK